MCVSQVIYVSRNPKDVAVSFYHFHKLAAFLPDFSAFEEFLRHFLEGRREFKVQRLQEPLPNVSISPCCVSVCYGSWFDHIKGWTDQRRAPSNLLHVTYEEMSLVDQHGADSSDAALLSFRFQCFLLCVASRT